MAILDFRIFLYGPSTVFDWCWTFLFFNFWFKSFFFYCLLMIQLHLSKQKNNYIWNLFIFILTFWLHVQCIMFIKISANVEQIFFSSEMSKSFGKNLYLTYCLLLFWRENILCIYFWETNVESFFFFFIYFIDLASNNLIPSWCLPCILIFIFILWMRKWKIIQGELIWPICGLLSFVWQSSMT